MKKQNVVASKTAYLTGLKEKLRRKEIVFEESGQRGVDLANEIDELKLDIEVEKLSLRPPSNRAALSEIRKMIEYLWEKEQKDWYGGAPDPMTLSEHIFGNLVRVNAWLRLAEKRR